MDVTLELHSQKLTMSKEVKHISEKKNNKIVSTANIKYLVHKINETSK